jgi:hypothetical protein
MSVRIFIAASLDVGWIIRAARLGETLVATRDQVAPICRRMQLRSIDAIVIGTS